MMTDFRALCAELTAWAEKTSAHYFQPPDVLLRARAALADEPPEPAPPADGEVAELTGQLVEAANGAAAMGWDQHAQRILRAAELLQRHVVVPVAVSERLPGPEDCADEGWAWFYTPRGDWIKAVLPVSPAYTHWLPAHALPLPEVGE